MRALSSIITAAAVALVLSGCSRRNPLDGPEGAVLTYYEVAKLAEDAARAERTDVDAYSPPVVSFDSAKSQNHWTASFTFKGEARPGQHFIVLVDDKSKRTQYLPGE